MEDKTIKFCLAEDKISRIVDSYVETKVKLQRICDHLHTEIPHYDWVGFYLVTEDSDNELVLGPFAGEPTEHVKIPFGKGICGQAAERKETFLVDDVSKETNYLSCSPNVKSEIVVPIQRGKVLIGELDIDSHTPSAFTDEDKKFLENACNLISMIWEDE